MIRGGGRGFCGGGDVNEIIGELIEMAPKDLIGFTRMTGEVIRAMRECPVPIVAASRGSRRAPAPCSRWPPTSGCVRRARVRVPVHQGRALRRRHGRGVPAPAHGRRGRATELLLLGDTIDAETADRYGLASQLVDEDGLDDAVDALARRLADGPTLAFAQTKLLITRELDMPIGRRWSWTR